MTVIVFVLINGLQVAYVTASCKPIAREARHQRVRALIAQLPPGSLKEDVQLDMVYGLLSTRIREKIPRSGFKSYAELLSQARRLEDLFEEGRPRQRKTDAGDKLSPAVPQKSASPSTSTVKAKSRSLCGYCKKYGHEKADCSRLRERNQTKATDGTSSPPSVSSLVCFGCGAPGVIRANCTTCRASSTSSAMPFQAVAAVSATCQPRSRPVMRVGMYGEYARLLVDTGAKQSIASDSLRNFLCKNNHVFHKVHYDFKFANGVTNSDIVETALVDVTVQGVVVPTQFVVLPGATESLLGINFVRDAGLPQEYGSSRNVAKPRLTRVVVKVPVIRWAILYYWRAIGSVHVHRVTRRNSVLDARVLIAYADS
ncbi:hypothetical protein O3G_MSEX015198 [Manduca sexta]|uniref:Retropepsins domain-containing protein n=1 Tax=Manduca sexta TaxID=7130 RepID=A0A922D1E5_MANSE|nr:hypothetical protein O3G_MSEX015198 [Manduca sexta]